MLFHYLWFILLPFFGFYTPITPTQNHLPKEVPVLCFHHIRPDTMHHLSPYSVTVSVFKADMKILHDSGYHTILPDQLYDYLTKGTPLPPKPVMITFDDNDGEQFTIAKPTLDQYGFKGVFFIMTVTMGKPHYMNKEQIKQLAVEGHQIGLHTWDHHMVTRYTEQDWVKQLDEPKKMLEQLIGKPIPYFAYPYGVWNEEAIAELKKRNIKMAFQLSSKIDPRYPLFTVRRIIVPNSNSPQTLLNIMRRDFH
ncbi:polysaccharide deacetylase family protein [Thermoflavifilum thermophilum]|uniref:Polysaccharide deacetylase n=1 Tax=Thermoflavifilum thermophilum TaxID=1393122 RepID=A0A1I7NFH4_9BACT|nr:polysaccharide deacetylase family protein [Thermoflavifilum thermophilum]SFV33390.1 Polysaccharide deacetylase [Thermoflavifilum thermophilum]